jgi:hypothetical protein
MLTGKVTTEKDRKLLKYGRVKRKGYFSAIPKRLDNYDMAVYDSINSDGCSILENADYLIARP